MMKLSPQRIGSLTFHADRLWFCDIPWSDGRQRIIRPVAFNREFDILPGVYDLYLFTVPEDDFETPVLLVLTTCKSPPQWPSFENPAGGESFKFIASTNTLSVLEADTDSGEWYHPGLPLPAHWSEGTGDVILNILRKENGRECGVEILLSSGSGRYRICSEKDDGQCSVFIELFDEIEKASL